ncbi:MAG: glycerol-3-phosphate dehydrogenase/oxidase [Armatimonadetes bacterium]|nr:glycerol-3-phosphate dehydrogenase/oxidase [Armatimonadota bacterium]
MSNRGDLETMAREEYDLLVIGGGILGCGVARDPAMRGLRVALVEKEDLGYGTTSRSTRLIHGGLRYLELFDFALVHEGLHERQHLLQIAPHLVRGIPFLTPSYVGDRWGPLFLRAGMVLYDLLSLGKSLPSHRMLTPAQVRELEPGIRSEGLRGGALYYDAQVAYPERLCVENALCAQKHGAQIANYAEARQLLRDGQRVCGALVEDRLTGATHPIRARLTVNAAGPWADEVARLASPEARPVLRRTKGIHLLVPSFTRHAIVLQARRDGRIFFAVPWEGNTLIGTTDTDYEESPDQVTALPDEVRYLVEETRRVFPHADLGHVFATTAGVRALVRSRKKAESDVSRRHRIVDHAREGTPGLLSLFGGKITAYRAIAAEAVDLVGRILGRRMPCRTAVEPLPGGSEAPEVTRCRLAPRASAIGLDEEQVEHLVGLYGTRAAEVLALAEADARLRERITPGHPEILAQIHHACRAEMAVTPADFLLRRTGIGFRPDHGLDALERVSREFALLLGWSAEHEREECRRYEAAADYLSAGIEP